MFNSKYETVKAILILVVIVAVIVTVSSVVKWGESLTPARTVTVTADAQTQVAPDLATVSFSVVTVGADPVKIEADNASQMNSAIAFIKQEGIGSNDITTTDYSLYPNYSYDYKRGKTAIVSYTITETETLKVRDFTKIAPILGGLTNLGVNQVGQVSFSVEDPSKYMSGIRSEAFAKAQAKAEQMATANGVKLGEIVSLAETTNNPQPLPQIYNSMARSAAGGSVTPTIQPGTQQLTDQVSITYAIQ